MSARRATVETNSTSRSRSHVGYNVPNQELDKKSDSNKGKEHLHQRSLHSSSQVSHSFLNKGKSDVTDARQEEEGRIEKMDWDRYGPADRSEWWKREIKPNPSPGTYRVKTFIEELEAKPVRPTYGFKSDGRKHEPGIVQNGETLLPGAYEHMDFLYWSNKIRRTYGFQSKSRDDSKNPLTEGLVDKSLDNLCPGLYNVEKQNAIDGTPMPCKHFMFKSRSKRLPSKEFVGRPGPEPGLYEVNQSWSVPAASIMRSRAPRFQYSHTKVPGPGTYERMESNPKSTTLVASMGRNHGLFFDYRFD